VDNPCGYVMAVSVDGACGMTEGHLIAMGPCWSCGTLFTFDPDLVPSLPIDPETSRPPDLGGDPARAISQPICQDCIAKANANRSQAGRPLIHIPEGAYL
jgi:hypothetical protein